MKKHFMHFYNGFRRLQQKSLANVLLTLTKGLVYLKYGLLGRLILLGAMGWHGHLRLLILLGHLRLQGGCLGKI
ncbi:MAG: hypothetical protein LIP16_07295 [Clostridium sp.]|nr:hypothetical protein [Clostridium sp.]